VRLPFEFEVVPDFFDYGFEVAGDQTAPDHLADPGHAESGDGEPQSHCEPCAFTLRLDESIERVSGPSYRFPSQSAAVGRCDEHSAAEVYGAAIQLDIPQFAVITGLDESASAQCGHLGKPAVRVGDEGAAFVDGAVDVAGNRNLLGHFTGSLGRRFCWPAWQSDLHDAGDIVEGMTPIRFIAEPGSQIDRIEHLHADLCGKRKMRQRKRRQTPRDAKRHWHALHSSQLVQPQQPRDGKAVVQHDQGVVTAGSDHRHDLDIGPVRQPQKALVTRKDDLVPVAPWAQGLDIGPAPILKQPELPLLSSIEPLSSRFGQPTRRPAAHPCNTETHAAA
jgi:hypothetical protein